MDEVNAGGDDLFVFCLLRYYTLRMDREQCKGTNKDQIVCQLYCHGVAGFEAVSFGYGRNWST